MEKLTFFEKINVTYIVLKKILITTCNQYDKKQMLPLINVSCFSQNPTAILNKENDSLTGTLVRAGTSIS